MSTWIDFPHEERESTLAVGFPGRRLEIKRLTETIPAVSGYEPLLSIALSLKRRHDLDGLFTALKSELKKVVNFDFIGIALFDELTQRADWRHSGPEGSIERGVVAEGREERASKWVYQHQRPLIIPSQNHRVIYQDHIEDFACDGIRSMCAFPLRSVDKRLGSLHIGSRRE